MKIAGYILSFYLILLAAVPCCAFDDCPEDKTELAAEHEAEEDDCGTCSPFFSCEGCSAATIAYEPTPIEIAPLQSLTVYTVYIQTTLPSIDYDFWQPPKLV
jgi:hypothetical protein